jgi:hypothetical protein
VSVQNIVRMRQILLSVAPEIGAVLFTLFLQTGVFGLPFLKVHWTLLSNHAVPQSRPGYACLLLYVFSVRLPCPCKLYSLCFNVRSCKLTICELRFPSASAVLPHRGAYVTTLGRWTRDAFPCAREPVIGLHFEARSAFMRLILILSSQLLPSLPYFHTSSCHACRMCYMSRPSSFI